MSTVQDRDETMIAVNLTVKEIETLRQLSTAEHLPEDILLRKWVLEGLNQLRLDRACNAYDRGELNLSGAAYYAGIGVEQMMRELTRRGIDHSPSVGQFVDGLEVLADLFDKEELRAAAKQVQQRNGE